MAISAMPPSGEVIEICAQKGIDVRSHRSRFLDSCQVEQSDIIFVMTAGHAQQVLNLCPAAADKCMLLDASNEVPDPIGAGIQVYRHCAEQIERALTKRLSEIL